PERRAPAFSPPQACAPGTLAPSQCPRAPGDRAFSLLGYLRLARSDRRRDGGAGVGVDDRLIPALLWRNARFRAFAASGVPVRGRWICSGGRCEVAIACLRCCSSADRVRSAALLAEDPRASLQRTEESALGSATLLFCHHLSPLLHPEPEEIRSLI